MPETVFCDSSLLQLANCLLFVDGYLYACTFTNSSLVKIDSQGNATSLFTSPGGQQFTGMVHVNGYFYLTAGSNIIYRIDINGNNFISFATLPENGFGITYLNNFLYVCSGDPNVYKIDITNPGISTIFTSITTGRATYIAYDSNDNFYITQSLGSNIPGVIKCDINGNIIDPNFIPTGSFTAILIYNNKIYLANSVLYSSINQISEYDINGNLITDNYATGGLSYITGGIVFDNNGNFYVTNLLNDGITTNINILTPQYPCFKEGSKILTDQGYKLIQDLRKGHLVKTLLHGFKRIDLIGKREIVHSASKERIKDQLYQCSKDHFDEVFEPLILTGCHSILVDEFDSEEQREKVIEVNGDAYITDDKYRLPACLDERTTVYEHPDTYTIYHLALENDDYYMNYGIYANGLLVESCSKRYLKELSDMELIE